MLYNVNFSCSTEGSGGNLGLGNCNLDLGNVIGVIFLPKGTVFTRSQIPTILTQMKTMASSDTWATRLQIAKDFMGAELANVDATTATYGYGTEVTTVEAKVGRTYTLRGKCASRVMSGIHNRASSYDVVFIHAGNILNFATTTKDGEDAVKGFSIDRLEVGLYNETIGDTLPSFTLTITLSNADEWRNSAPIKPAEGEVLGELNSIKSIGLSYMKANPVVAGTYRISLEDCSTSDIVSTYASDIVDITNWIAENADTGAALAISSISVQNGQLVFTITSDANFTAATRIRIRGAAISVLEANDIEGFEFGSVEFNKA